MFKVLLGAGADALQMPDVVSSKGGLEISKWDVVKEQKYPALEDIDAILISGSRKFMPQMSHHQVQSLTPHYRA